MSGTETTATPEAPYVAKEEKEKFRWDKVWWWGMVVFVILLLIVATALALAKVNNKADGVLAAVNDTRKDFQKEIDGVKGKMGTFATISDHNDLVDRVAKHEKEDKKIHQAQERAARSAAKETPRPNASAVQEAPLQANPPAVSEPARPVDSDQKPERVDVTSIAADACGDRGIVRSGRFRSDGSAIWRCVDEVRVVQQEVSAPQGGVINVSPSQRRYYGANDQGSSYSWSQALGAGGVGCVVGALIDGGAGCARVLVGAVAGDFVDQKVVPNDKHIGAILVGGIGAGASWRYRHPSVPQGALIGGPVGMAP